MVAPIPIVELPSWMQTFAQDFTRRIPAGITLNYFQSAYASLWSVYDEGSGKNYSDNYALSVHYEVRDFTVDEVQSEAR